MLDAGHQAHGPDVVIVQQRIHAVHGCGRYIDGVEHGQPFGAAAGGQRVAQEGIDVVDVACAAGQIGKARIAEQIVAFDGTQEAPPLRVVVDQRAKVAVARGIGPAAG